MSLITDGAFFDASREVLRKHDAYRRRAHRGRTRARKLLATGASGMDAVNAADLLGDRVARYAPLICNCLDAATSSSAFGRARGEIRTTHGDVAAAIWHLDHVRHPGSVPLHCPVTPAAVQAIVHDAATEFRQVVDATRGAPKKVKDAARNTARLTLAARLCGLNQGVIACLNTRHSAFSTTASTALHS